VRQAPVRFLFEFAGLLTLYGALAGAVIGAAFGLLTFLITRARSRGAIPVVAITVLTAAFAFLIGAGIEPGYNSAVIFAALALTCALFSLRLLWRSPTAAMEGAAIDAQRSAAAL
jgi:uncharacterized membrane protein